ncbi:hypothetical protein GE115_11585 [Agromyces sp. CFH 90414]|uniref:Uncharacterized protein n=1 Tax=Agromyces agglutinans TaxID=2662258 RepID=A0A6I2F855_9MICO|nr:hypothetical protein [Agromyces agglutinans]MRG60501.1 hypothetical protein [Agromyces agglutinans]
MSAPTGDPAGPAPVIAPDATPAQPDTPPAPPATPATPRRRRRGLVWTASTLAVVLGGGFALAGVVTTDLIAARFHERAWAEWSAADERHTEAVSAESHERRFAEELIGRTDALRPVMTADLVGEAELAALNAELDELRVLAEAPAGDAAPGVAELEPRAPAPVWTRYASGARLGELTPKREADAEQHEHSAEALVAARDEVHAGMDDISTSAVALAEAVLAAHPSATHRTRLDLDVALDAIDDIGAPPEAADFTALATSLAAVRSAHAAEEARKLDPRYPVRAEIEAYARSIAAGVPLDFAWAYEVAGRPSDGWFAGTAEFFEYGDDWGLITLTDSISDSWPDANARAVVVHEVGHTQVVRDACAAIFRSPVFGGDHEVWATAWAIGMGHDVPGAGIEAYGRPSDEQIEASRACR